MPIDYEIDEAAGWVSITASGVLTDEDVLEYRRRLLSDPRLRPGMKLLSDLRAIQHLQVTADGVRRLVHHETAHAGRIGKRRLAVVVGSVVVYGMARMYEMLAENIAGRIQVFRDIDEARAWLTSEQADLDQDPGTAQGPLREG